jgi:predicted extracellular nuclease
MAAFTPGNLVVYRVGTGTGALGSAATAVFLDEYTPTGTLVQSIAMPTADSGSNQTLTAAGNSTSEGFLDLSSDGRYLVLGGYDAAVGTASIAGTASASVNRVIGRVDANGNVDTTTALTNAFSGGNIRGVTSVDGTSFWATGSNTGVVYATFGANTGTIVSSNVTNLRAIDIFDNQLYVSSGSGTNTFRGVNTVGTGTPTTTGQVTTRLPGLADATNPSSYGFVFFDLSAAVAGMDTLYIADDSAGQIQKFTFNGTNWAADGSVAASGVRGLTGSLSGSDVSLYATSGTTLFFVADSSGYDGTLTGTAVTRATAATNTAFRGIDFAPQAAGPALPVLNISDVTQAEGTTPGTTDFTFSVTLTAPAGAGGVTFDIATADGTAQDDNPATEDADYVARALTGQNIPAGSTGPFTFTVTVNNDNIREGNETFLVNVTNIVGATAGDAQGTGTITDDDTPVLSIADVSQAEGAAGTSVLTFTVSLNQPAPFGGVTFDIATADSAATDADNDYEPRTLTTQTIAEGATSYTFDVTVNGDTVFEADELFVVNVTNVTGATVGDGQAAGTIQNDDAAPVGTFSVDDVTHDEGDSGPTNYTFTVSRTAGSAGAATVDYAIAAPGGAGIADGADFAAGGVFSGTLSFADGETSKTISIDVQGDSVVEPTETFTVTLSNATGGASIADASGTGTIANDDALPPAGSVSIADAQIVEGNSGTSLLVLTLTRSGGAAPFAVDYATANGGNPNNASATAGGDYVAQSGTVNFAENESVKTISITINGDTAFELNEEFRVGLSNATGGATIGDPTAIATITNDDSAPTTFRLLEEDFTGFTAGGFAPNPTAAQIDSDIWRVVGLSDVPNPAYGFTATTGDFARGTIGTNDPVTAGVYSPTSNPALALQPTSAEIENSGFIEARVQNSSGSTATGFNIAFDWAYRNSGDRSSNLQFSYSTDGINFIPVPDAAAATPTTAGAATGAFTLQNEMIALTGLSVPDQGFVYLRWTHLSSAGSGNRDEFGIDNVTVDATTSGPPPLTVSVSDVSVNEAAGTMTFTVTRNSLVTGAFTVDYATADGTAIAVQDYTATSGTLSFTDNQVQATVTVPITDDATPEFDDTVLLNLSNPTGGATVVDSQGVGTIVNDDGAPISVSIGDVTVTEGQSGTTVATFTVTRTGGTGAFTIDYATADQTAVAPGDYLAASGTLSFAENDMSETVTVTINGDALSEDSETFRVQLSNPTNNALIADAVGVGTIATDDPIFIHQVQGSSYYSPILAAEGKNGFNVASTTVVIIRAVVTAVDAEGTRQGFYVTEELADWDSNAFTSEGIFVMTRNDANAGTTVSAAAPNIQVGDIVTFSAQVMEYQSFSSMPRTSLVNMTGFSISSSGNSLPVLTLDAGRPIPNSILTGVTPDYTDSADGAGDTFDASLYALSYFETVEGMLVTIPDMVVADGFVQTVGTANDPVFQAYSRVHADADQINSRGGYTIAGDPPLSPPDTADTDDGTIYGGRHIHDGDANPDIIELDFSDFAMSYPAGQLAKMSMGDGLGNVTGIIDFDFTDRKLFVTSIDPAAYQDTVPAQETTTLGNDDRALTVATFNVENLDPTDGAARFAALAQVMANNLNSPDIIIIEEMQDSNGGRENSEPASKGAGDGTSPTGTDASVSWQMLVDALNAAVPGANYQWVDEAPVYNSEGGQNNGNIRVGFLYDTNRVQLGDLAPDATIAERRQFTDRIGDGTRDAGDRILFSDNMIAGEINTADWAGTRKSLLGQFTFNGQTVFVAANHFPAKSGSGNFWQFNQNLEAGQPVNSDFAQRNAVANDLYTMLNLIESNAPGSGVVSGGDYNDFYFYRPLEVATGYVLPDGTARTGGARFDNLTVTELTEAERYSYTFDGRSQTLDHIIVNSMLSGVASYDVVHVNTGYSSFGTGANASPALSDHDPAVASFDFRSLSETLVGTPQADTFNLGQGGDDTVSGLAGDDIFYFGGALTAADNVNGGDGFDTILLQGNYSGGLTLDGSVTEIESISVLAGTNTAFGDPGTNLYDYDLTTHDDNFAAGLQVKINASALLPGEDFTFDGSAETDAKFVVYGGKGKDDLTGGAGNDTFFFAHDGRFAAGDKVEGGGGYDALFLRGNYTIDFTQAGYAGAFLDLENMTLSSASDQRYARGGGTEFDYSIKWDDDLLGSGRTITINASLLTAEESLAFNGTDESNGTFKILGGGGNDVLTGGAGADVIIGGLRGDTLTGGAGNDVFRYDSTADSNSTEADGIQDFNSGDLIDLSRIDANVLIDGNQAFNFIGNAEFSKTAGELRFANISNGGPIWKVQGDTDGNGVSDFEVVLVINPPDPITSGDFIL